MKAYTLNIKAALPKDNNTKTATRVNIILSQIVVRVPVSLAHPKCQLQMR